MTVKRKIYDDKKQVKEKRGGKGMAAKKKSAVKKKTAQKKVEEKRTEIKEWIVSYLITALNKTEFKNYLKSFKCHQINHVIGFWNIIDSEKSDHLSAIEERIKELLQETEDIENVLRTRENTDPGTCPQTLCEQRLDQLYADEDINDLGYEWEQTSRNTEPRRLVIKHFEIKLQEENDFEDVVDLHSGMPSDSEFMQSIENYLEQKILPDINDIDEMARVGEPAPPKLREIIRARICELIEEVDAENLPDWFMCRLFDPDNIDNYYKHEFTEKVIELSHDYL